MIESTKDGTTDLASSPHTAPITPASHSASAAGILTTGGYKLVPPGLLLLAFAVNDSIPGTFGYRRLIDIGLIFLAAIAWAIVDTRHRQRGVVTTWAAWTSFRRIPPWMIGVFVLWLIAGKVLAEVAGGRRLETLVWSVALGVTLIVIGVVEEFLARRRRPGGDG